MSLLRWILIAAGAVLLIGIYLWGRRSDKRSAGASEALLQARSQPQIEPTFESASYDMADEPQPVDEPALFDPVEEPVVVHASAHVEEPSVWGNRGVRREPTLGGSDSLESEMPAVMVEDDVVLTAELPAREPLDAPTLGMSSTPAPRRIERRKIIALRLAAGGQRYSGDALRSAMESQSLQHGRYDVFHRLHDDGASIFSIASMVEPGTFELERMIEQQYSGVTMFAQLPGPVPGVQALQDLVACGKHLQEILGGTLQDERGVPLTVHRIDRLRQEVVDFERGQARDSRTAQH